MSRIFRLFRLTSVQTY